MTGLWKGVFYINDRLVYKVTDRPVYRGIFLPLTVDQFMKGYLTINGRPIYGRVFSICHLNLNIRPDMLISNLQCLLLPLKHFKILCDIPTLVWISDQIPSNGMCDVPLSNFWNIISVQLSVYLNLYLQVSHSQLSSFLLFIYKSGYKFHMKKCVLRICKVF